MNYVTRSVLPKMSAVFLSAILLSSCGGGSGSASSNPVNTTNTGSNTNLPSNDGPASNNPSEPTNQPTSQPTASTTFPFGGTITVDEYDWFSSTSAYLGIIDITLDPLAKKRLLDGSQPRRHDSGSIVYRQPCGSRVHRIIEAAADLSSSRQITPCSNTVANPGASPTNFGLSTLSPDSRHVAVEAIYFLNSDFQVSTVVFNVSTQKLVAIWDNAGSPMWLPDGSVLLGSGQGFYVGRLDQDGLEKLPDGLTSAVKNPALHPTENLVAFEYNQQIWLMNTDGTNAREAIYAGTRLRFPTWSPDGNALAYLSLPDGDRYEEAILFTDMEKLESYRLDLNPVMDRINSSATVNGPMSWR